MIRLALAALVAATGCVGPGSFGHQVSDDPCQLGTHSWVPAGADYDGPTNLWSLDGVAFGYSVTEDGCWTPVKP